MKKRNNNRARQAAKKARKASKKAREAARRSLAAEETAIDNQLIESGLLTLFGEDAR